MKAASLRLRLTAWYSAVLLAGLALFGVAMWWALEHRLVAAIDTRLEQRIRGLRNALEVDAEIRDCGQLQQELAEFAGQIPDGARIQLQSGSGAAIVPFPDQPVFSPELAGKAAEPLTVMQDRKPFRIAAGRVRCAGETFDALVAVPLDDLMSVMRDFRRMLWMMVPAVLVLATLGGYWLSSRALRPVDEITRVAQRISVQNLSQRIAAPETGDELQRMAQAWNDVLERLEGAVGRIRQFSADASHELRTPLALIRATAELALRRERDADEYRKSLRIIESEAEHMTVLAEALLTVARADAGAFPMALEPTDLSEVAIAAVRQNEAAAAVKGVRLVAESNGHFPRAQANESGLRRVLLILIDNALRHTPPGGQVMVSAEVRDGESVLSVTDTGEGIAADALPHIFDRFYRGDPARGRSSGFGLGLSIAQAIAEAHGSAIAVESSPGAGARFSMRFSQFSGR